MEERTNRVSLTRRLRVDAYTRFCLTAIAALLTVLIVGLWSEAIPQPTRASAAVEPFGDAAGERKALVAAQEQTNVKLDELIKLLRSGDVKVQVTTGGGDGSTTKTR